MNPPLQQQIRDLAQVLQLLLALVSRDRTMVSCTELNVARRKLDAILRIGR